MTSDNINFSLQGQHDYLTYLVHTTLHDIECVHMIQCLCSDVSKEDTASIFKVMEFHSDG